MKRTLTKEDAYKIYKLFRLALPDDVDITCEIDLLHRAYQVSFRRIKEGFMYLNGFYCTKRGFQKNSWYLLKKIIGFYKKPTDYVKKSQNIQQN